MCVNPALTLGNVLRLNYTRRELGAWTAPLGACIRRNEWESRGDTEVLPWMHLRLPFSPEDVCGFKDVRTRPLKVRVRL